MGELLSQEVELGTVVELVPELGRQLVGAESGRLVVVEMGTVVPELDTVIELVPELGRQLVGAESGRLGGVELGMVLHELGRQLVELVTYGCHLS